MELIEILRIVKRVEEKLMATSVVLEQYIEDDNEVLQGCVNIVEDCYDELGVITEKAGISLDIPLPEFPAESVDELQDVFNTSSIQ